MGALQPAKTFYFTFYIIFVYLFLFCFCFTGCQNHVIEPPCNLTNPYSRVLLNPFTQVLDLK